MRGGSNRWHLCSTCGSCPGLATRTSPRPPSPQWEQRSGVEEDVVLRLYRPESRYKHVVTRTVVEELQFLRQGHRAQVAGRFDRILSKPSLEASRHPGRP